MSSLIEKFYAFKLKQWRRLMDRKDPFDAIPPVYVLLRWLLFPKECFYWSSGIANRWTPMNGIYVVRKSWFDEKFLIISGPSGRYKICENGGVTSLEKLLEEGGEG